MTFRGCRSVAAGHRMQHAARSAGALVLLLVALGHAHAQPGRSLEEVDSPGLVIEALAGWDGRVDRRTPVPLSFLIRNDSSRLIEGELRLSDPIRGHEVTLGEVAISPGGTRRFSSIQALSEWFECSASFTENGQILWRRELPLPAGSGFDGNVSFALFVDAGGRKLQFPPRPATTSERAPIVRDVVADEQGRSVECLAAKAWQIPTHPGPLLVVQAIVFSETTDAADLNRAQWRAVAEWICQGGVAFVYGQSREILDRLSDVAPLSAGPQADEPPFVVRRLGLGAIYEYPQPLLTPAGSELRQSVGQTVAKLPKEHIGMLAKSGFLYQSGGERADRNRIVLLAFFGLYLLLSGPVAIVLFRLSQRRIAIYAIVVVGGACVFAGLLGGYLRTSKGDLQWITVTEAGAGGAVQVANIEVHSAGGRNSHLAIEGDNVDLQLVGGERRSYALTPWETRPLMPCPPFSWQASAAEGADVSQVGVPLTPWGRRRLFATAYQPHIQPLDFALAYQPGELWGTFTLKVASHLPFDLVDCFLIVGATQPLAAQVSPAPQRQRSPRAEPVAEQGLLIDAYGQYPLKALLTGAAREEQFVLEFQPRRGDRDPVVHFPGGGLDFPRLARLGTASAWIVGRVKPSPAMTIAEDRTDFGPGGQLHIFIQEILPENMPDPALFSGAKSATGP